MRAVRLKRKLAVQTGILGIADRPGGGKAIERAAQNKDDEGMTLDRIEHVGEFPEHERPDCHFAPKWTPARIAQRFLIK